MEQALQIFNYNEVEVEFFQKGRNSWCNVTPLAKLFDKRTHDFLRLDSTEEFIDIMLSRYGISRNEAVRTSKNGGTWMIRKLAIKFARWVSVELEEWLSEKFEGLVFEIIDALSQNYDETIEAQKRVMLLEDKFKSQIIEWDEYVQNKEKLRLLRQQKPGLIKGLFAKPIIKIRRNVYRPNAAYATINKYGRKLIPENKIVLLQSDPIVIKKMTTETQNVYSMAKNSGLFHFTCEADVETILGQYVMNQISKDEFVLEKF